jgi:phospholipase A1
MRWVRIVLMLGTLLGWERAVWADPSTHAFPLEPHKSNYFLTTWDGEPHAGRQDKEFKFQLSFKKLILGRGQWPLYFAYSQLAHWQWYDQNDSRPFRTQTHNPEVFLDIKWNPAPSGETRVRVGFEHESNGQATGDSRSWNRAYLWPSISYPRWENLTLGVKAWWRFPESKKRGEADPNGDDNPDIEAYLGHSELYVTQFSQGPGDALPYRRLALMLRHGTRAGTVTTQLELDYHLHKVWGLFNEGIYLRVQWFYGYGESLIDYNRLVKKFGIGFSFY